MLDNVKLLPHFSRRTASVMLIVIVLLLLATPALAIVYGEPDGDDHPFVGAIVVFVPELGGFFQWCSGTLIGENVFLTAAHCTDPLPSILENFPNAYVQVTFDPTIDPNNGAFFDVAAMIEHPEFFNFQGQYGLSDPRDVAVILLDQAPPEDITRASLPPVGLLDDLRKAKLLNDTRFTAVGYGTIRETHMKAFDSILANLDRNRAEQGFFSLTKAWLTLPMLPMIDSGGTCYGDSGGPHFIHLEGVETNIIASITVTGDAVCKATDKTYRMDTQKVHDFLGNYVDLP
jgi:secreted trypsin-like serine protease